MDTRKAKKRARYHDSPSGEFDFTEIDTTDVFKELAGQAKRYRQYADKLALARKKETRAKARKELKIAEMSLGIRQRHEDYGFSEKPTEKAIEHTIICSEEYQAVNDEHIRAIHTSELMESACEALRQRCKMLERMAYMKEQDLHAEPKVDKANLPMGKPINRKKK